MDRRGKGWPKLSEFNFEWFLLSFNFVPSKCYGISLPSFVLIIFTLFLFWTPLPLRAIIFSYFSFIFAGKGIYHYIRFKYNQIPVSIDLLHSHIYIKSKIFWCHFFTLSNACWLMYFFPIYSLGSLISLHVIHHVHCLSLFINFFSMFHIILKTVKLNSFIFKLNIQLLTFDIYLVQCSNVPYENILGQRCFWSV